MTLPFNMHFQCFGAGQRKVLAVHCTLSHAGAWHRMARLRAEQWTITACDLPGHGESDPLDSSANMLETAVSGLLEQLSEDVDLIGHSFGAVVALRLAQRWPERIRRLCLFEPVLFAASALDDPGVLARHIADTEPVMAALSRGDSGTAARLFNRIWGDGRPWEEISPQTRAYITDRMHCIEAQEDVLIDDSAGMLKPASLSRVAMPVLLMTGTQSPGIVNAIAKALVTRLPLAQRIEIAGAGHMGPVTHAEDVANAVGSFLEMAEEEVEMLCRDGPVTDKPR
ncbi:MAG: alpha/beta hydrolase [Pseudomonadota bacterium]